MVQPRVLVLHLWVFFYILREPYSIISSRSLSDRSLLLLIRRWLASIIYHLQIYVQMVALRLMSRIRTLSKSLILLLQVVIRNLSPQTQPALRCHCSCASIELQVPDSRVVSSVSVL
jgi:hypothetical protein